MSLLLLFRAAGGTPVVGAPGLPALFAECAFGNDPGDTALVWVDLSNKARAVKIQRGRNMELDQVETGMATPTLDNRDRALDPAYTSSPHYPNVIPVKPFRVRAAKGTTAYPLFRGDVEDWPQIWDPGSRDNVTEFNVLDAFDPLKDVDIPTTFTRPAELSGDRVNAILDAAGWASTERVIDTGRSFVQPVDLTDGTRKALEMLQEVAVAESGVVFIDASGKFVFQDRVRREVASSPIATFSNQPGAGEFPFTEAKVDDSKDLIKNDIHVTITDGATYVAQDADSIRRFRPRSYSVTVPLNTPEDGPAKAYWLLNLYKDAQYRVAYIKIAPQMDDSLWAHALGREIGDRITVKVFPPGGGDVVQVDSVIERVEHEYEVGVWTTTWYLSPASSQTYWVAGVSAAGITTRAAY